MWVLVLSKQFATDWRSGMFEMLGRVKTGELPTMNADAIHRLVLDDVLKNHNSIHLSAEERDDLNLVWQSSGLPPLLGPPPGTGLPRGCGRMPGMWWQDEDHRRADRVLFYPALPESPGTMRSRAAALGASTPTMHQVFTQIGSWWVMMPIGIIGDKPL